MRVLASTGMLSVRGSPRPGKDVMSRLTPCACSSSGAEAAGATGVVATVAMVVESRSECIWVGEAEVEMLLGDLLCSTGLTAWRRDALKATASQSSDAACVQAVKLGSPVHPNP